MTASKDQSIPTESTSLLQPQHQQQQQQQPDTFPTCVASRFINTSPRTFYLTFTSILLGCVISSFDSTLMASSHPAITSHFRAADSASWLSTSFLLTWTAFVPCFGRISDVVGRKPMYLLSIGIFLVSTAWCGAAPSIGSLIAARAFCGLGAGGVSSMGMIISSDMVRLRYRGIYQSYINLCLGVGGCFGLVFGGYLCDTVGWRGAFYVQLPILVLFLLLTAIVTPANLGVLDDGPSLLPWSSSSSSSSSSLLSGKSKMSVLQLLVKIDLVGSVMLVLGLTALVVGLNLGGNVVGWSHPLVIASLLAFVMMTAIFVPYERTVPRAVMPMAVLTQDPRASIILGNVFASLSINTMLFNTPLYFQAVKLATPAESGLKLVSSTLALTVSSVAAGFILTWTQNPKPIILLGGVCLLAGGVTATVMDAGTPSFVAMVGIALSSLGQGFSYPTLMISILASSSREDLAVASTTLGLWRNLGSLLGVAISSLIYQNALVPALDTYITGPEKAEVIRLVRKSVHAIAELDPVHQQQAIEAFAVALRFTFLSAAVWPVFMLFFHGRMRLPCFSD